MTLPNRVKPYSSTPVFDETSLPKGLQKSHCTKAGTWGVLRLLSGTLDFIIETTGKKRSMVAGEQQLIAPEEKHHVALNSSMTMQIDFYKERPTLQKE